MSRLAKEQLGTFVTSCDVVHFYQITTANISMHRFSALVCCNSYLSCAFMDNFLICVNQSSCGTAAAQLCTSEPFQTCPVQRTSKSVHSYGQQWMQLSALYLLRISPSVQTELCSSVHCTELCSLVRISCAVVSGSAVLAQPPSWTLAASLQNYPDVSSRWPAGMGGGRRGRET